MPKRLNALSLAVVLAGAAALQPPARLQATWRDPTLVLMSCCEARAPMAGVIMSCCSMTGCAITQYGCVSLR
jgi:hypothetical protein